MGIFNKVVNILVLVFALAGVALSFLLFNKSINLLVEACGNRTGVCLQSVHIGVDELLRAPDIVLCDDVVAISGFLRAGQQILLFVGTLKGQISSRDGQIRQKNNEIAKLQKDIQRLKWLIDPDNGKPTVLPMPVSAFA